MLVKRLFQIGKRMAYSIFTKYQVNNVTIEDVEDYILEIIYYIFETYEPRGKTFDECSRYILYKRLTSKIMGMAVANNLNSKSLDDILEDGTPIIELIPNKDCFDIPNEISLNELDLIMSSPKVSDSKSQKLQKKIYKLQNEGYSSRDIKEILNITENQLRYLIEKNNKNIKELEFKIKMK